MNQSFWQKSNVLIAGHTGLIGKWPPENLLHASRAADTVLSTTVLSRVLDAVFATWPYFKDKVLSFCRSDVFDPHGWSMTP